MNTQYLHFLIKIIILVMLASCAAPGPIYDNKSLDQAIATGQLESFYQGLLTEMKQGKKNPALLEKARKLLSQLKIDRLVRNIESSRNLNGFIPLDKIPGLDALPHEIALLNAENTQKYQQFLQDELEKTNLYIQKQFKSAEASVNHPIEQLGFLQDAMSVAGNNQDYVNAANEIKQEIVLSEYKNGLQQLDQLNFDEAKKHFELVKSIAPDYQNLQMRFTQIEVSEFDAKFNGFVEMGDVDKAYDLLMENVDKPYFPEIAKVVKPMAKLVAGYFSGRSKDAITKKDYQAAYPLLKKSKDVFVTLELQDTVHSQEETLFLEAIFKLHQKANQQKRYGLALAHLKMIEEFRPDYPDLTKALRESLSKVKLQGIKGVSISAFSNQADANSQGSVISSRLTRYLLDNLSHDVRLVEREQLENVIRENQLKKDEDSAHLAVADYFIEGNIDTSRVDSSINKSQDKHRVVTSHKDVSNPAYEAWEKSSKKGEAPPKFLSEPQYEDVTLQLDHHKKVGLETVSYRIIDASSAKVISSNTISQSEEHSGDSIEGLSIGEFVQKSVFVEIPSDIEILDSLTHMISQKIGEELQQFFSDQDVKYQQMAERLKNEGNLSQAVEQYANAYVIAAEKNKDFQPVLQDLKELSVKPEVLH